MSGGARRLLISRSPGEIRWAFLDAEDRLLDLFLRRDHRLERGDVVLGRVVGRSPAGALVEVGEAVPALLDGPADDGAALLVQVCRPAGDGKGCGVTRAVELTAGPLLYTPGRPGLSLSRAIADPAARDRLKRLLSARMEKGEGVLLRTAAAEAEEAALLGALTEARARWSGLRERADKAEPPARLLSGWDEAVAPYLPGIGAVLCDHGPTLAGLKSRWPDAVLWSGSGTLFAAEGIEEAIETALARSVALPGGGRLVFDRAEALTAIDIDAGGAKPTEVNRAAVAAIAAQVRLRAIGGQIVVDPIDQARHDRKALYRFADALAEAVAADPVPTQVLGVTRMGLVEMLRERRRPSLADLSHGPEAAALDALRRIVRDGLASGRCDGRLTVAPAVAALLDGVLAPARREAEARLGASVAIAVDPALAPATVRVSWEGPDNR